MTAWQPTLITSPTEQVLEATRALATAPRSLGTHLEGPFLSPSRPGTHPVEHLREPDLGLLGSCSTPAPSRPSRWPWLPGALELVDELVERNITVSLGHTDATAIEAERAFARGARTVTHLFNAMRPFHHRDPGVVGAALARRDVVVQLIADGAHVADEACSSPATLPAAGWRSCRTQSPRPGSATVRTGWAVSRSGSRAASAGGPTDPCRECRLAPRRSPHPRPTRRDARTGRRAASTRPARRPTRGSRPAEAGARRTAAARRPAGRAACSGEVRRSSDVPHRRSPPRSSEATQPGRADRAVRDDR